MTFGEKIQKLRKESGFSQEELSELLGVSRQSVSNWERDNGMPEIEKIVRMSELFHVSTDYLLTEKPESEQTADSGTEGLYVSREMATGFLSYTKKKRRKIGLALAILLGGTSLSLFDWSGDVTVMYSILLLISLLLLISVKLTDNPYRRIRKETLNYDAEVKKKLCAEYACTKKIRYLLMLLGTAIILTGIFIFPLYEVLGDWGMILVGIGAYLCVSEGGTVSAYRILLK